MENWFPVQYCWLIPLLPIIGAAISGFFGKKILKGQSHWPIWLTVGTSAGISICLLVQMLQAWAHGEEQLAVTRYCFTWIQAGTFRADCAFFLDPLTAVMLTVVTGIGFFITVFSKGYMAGEEGYYRFFAYLGLFIFSMTCLVMGNNLVMLYLGWEGVGLCSYLLIGYYFDKPAAREAAKKAFLVNRVGDFGFALGIMFCFMAFGTISYFGQGPRTMTGLLELATLPKTNLQHTALYWIPFMLMLGAFGKSAQFPLYVWLPDAMEGPTPVSALIHAATMVTAGVYMIARCSTLFVQNETACLTVAAVGAFTALFSATIALRQFDLKKVFAYSTVSQLGFMFAGVGLLAPVAAVFHLVTHAFFKALLFLSSGVVMHAMMGELDMRKMSGVKKSLPLTNIVILIGCLALAGFPFLAGFFSKDEILAAAGRSNHIIAGVLTFAAFLTAYYTFRLYFRVFQGPEVIPAPPISGLHDTHGHDVDEHLTIDDPHSKHVQVTHGQVAGHGAHDHGHGHEHGHHNHEPLSMMIPLIVLAIGALLAGYLNWPERQLNLGGFLGHSPSFSLGYLSASSKPGSAINPVAWGQEVLNASGEKSAEHEPMWTSVMTTSAIISVIGILLAYWLHLASRKTADALAEKLRPITVILDNKYWVDEIYQTLIVNNLRNLGKLFFAIDKFIVDGLVWLVGFIPQLSGFSLKLTTQRGYLQGYAATMVLGIIIILICLFA